MGTVYPQLRERGWEEKHSPFLMHRVITLRRGDGIFEGLAYSETLASSFRTLARRSAGWGLTR